MDLAVITQIKPKDCTREVSRHRELCGLSADTELDSEHKLLLARAGKSTPVILMNWDFPDRDLI